MQRFYTIAKALLTIQQVKITNKKKFGKAILDENIEKFVVHIIFLAQN